MQFSGLPEDAGAVFIFKQISKGKFQPWLSLRNLDCFQIEKNRKITYIELKKFQSTLMIIVFVLRHFDLNFQGKN